MSADPQRTNIERGLSEYLGRGKIGDLAPATRNNSRLIDFIEFFLNPHIAILPNLIEFYQQGLSLRDIQCRTGISKTTIRKLLLGAGIDLRPKAPCFEATQWRKRGKRSARPVYGFTYFEGQIVKDQKEYPVLLLIHRLWKQGRTTTEITNVLNEKGAPSRQGKKWSWNAVTGIVERFKKGTVSI